MGNHRRIDAWKEARRLSTRVYFVVRGLAREDRYCFGSQLIRSANSVRNNIAEGSTGTDAEFAKSLSHSLGSAKEVLDQLENLHDIGLLAPADHDLLEDYDSVIAMLAALRNTVRRDAERKKKRGA